MKLGKKKEILSKDFDIPMSSTMNGEENIMCNLGAGIREQAEKETKIRLQQKHLFNLMSKLNLSIEDAMNILEISDEDKPSLLQMADSRLVAKNR